MFFSEEIMNKIKKLFGEYNMTWVKVIILAVASAVLTAVLNLIPALKDTSFQDIAIAYECWILFAVFIIVNCKKWWEASLKCFVFFLISQPLIFLIEVPFLGWGVFDYYKYWFVVTLLTLPGAVAAYQLKRRDWLSVLVMSVANGYLAYMCVKYFRSALAEFPNHLLSSVFCLALAIFFVFVFLDKKQLRIAALAVIAAVLIGTGIYTQAALSQEVYIGEGEWSYTVEDESVVDVEMTDGTATFKAKNKGGTSVLFKAADGTEHEYYATVTGGGVFVNEFTP